MLLDRRRASHAPSQYYREKIKAETEGRPYVAPPPSKADTYKGRSGAGMTRNSKSFQDSSWDDWGEGGGRGAKVRRLCIKEQIHACKIEAYVR
jgi:hypothetical protein